MTTTPADKQRAFKARIVCGELVEGYFPVAQLGPKQVKLDMSGDAPPGVHLLFHCRLTHPVSEVAFSEVGALELLESDLLSEAEALEEQLAEKRRHITLVHTRLKELQK